MIKIYTKDAKWPKFNKDEFCVLMLFDDEMSYLTFIDELTNTENVTIIESKKEEKKTNGPYK